MTADVLAASRCGACGLVAFPAERYGCERCGALPAEHRAVDLPAAGVVRSFAMVHRHHQPTPPVPFVVCQVDVDVDVEGGAGPSLKGVLDGSDVAIGDRVVGHFADEGFRWRIS